MLTIQTVQSPRDRQEFVGLARALYPPESPWVRPLDSVVLGYLDPSAILCTAMERAVRLSSNEGRGRLGGS